MIFVVDRSKSFAKVTICRTNCNPLLRKLTEPTTKLESLWSALRCWVAGTQLAHWLTRVLVLSLNRFSFPQLCMSVQWERGWATLAQPILVSRLDYRFLNAPLLCEGVTEAPYSRPSSGFKPCSSSAPSQFAQKQQFPHCFTYTDSSCVFAKWIAKMNVCKYCLTSYCTCLLKSLPRCCVLCLQ